MIPKMIRGFMELIEVKNIVPRFSWSKGSASQIIGCFLLTKRFYRISGGDYKLFQVACRDLPAEAQTRRGGGNIDLIDFCLASPSNSRCSRLYLFPRSRRLQEEHSGSLEEGNSRSSICAYLPKLKA